MDPKVNCSQWTKEEVWLVFLCQKVWGNKWNRFSALVNNRSENSIKNKFQTISPKEKEDFERQFIYKCACFLGKDFTSISPVEKGILEQYFDQDNLLGESKVPPMGP